MRLEGQSKLGYYPTPQQTLTNLLAWLSIAEPDDGLRRYLDPCCGKGEALAAIGAAHGPAETYGIELSDVRAVDARQRLTHVINTGYEYAVLGDETFSLILLNPPYDGEGETGGGTRMEETFLLNTTSRLVPGGVLIYLIPHARLNEKMARHLAGWYRDARCFKLPDDEYDVFKQIIVFGHRRPDYQAPAGDDLRAVQAWALGQHITGYREVEGPRPRHKQTQENKAAAPRCAIVAGVRGMANTGSRLRRSRAGTVHPFAFSTWSCRMTTCCAKRPRPRRGSKRVASGATWCRPPRPRRSHQ